MNIEYISKNWSPKFVIEENQMVSFLIYEGDNTELMVEKQRLLAEVGFNFENWYYTELSVENVWRMTSELLKKISDYEARTGNCVKKMFLNMILTSKWEQPFIQL